VHTLTGAYALDALDEFERRQFEMHLVECPDCAREVDELRATAARLGIAVAELPPEHLRRRVLDQISGTRQEAPTTGRAPAPRSARGWQTRLTALVAAIGVAAAVGLGVVVVRTENQLNAVRGELSRVQAQYGPIAAVLAARDARADTNTIPGVGSATVLASHSLDRALLVVSGMSVPPAKHAYQAWLVGSSGSPRPAGLLDVTGTGLVAPLLVGGLDGATVIKLTVEPAGGSVAPTTNPVMWVSVPG
jgi:anti-sigma-K factor RskA